MTRRVILSISLSSFYLLVFPLFLGFQNFTAAAWMFFFSPIPILWLVYTIIRHGEYNGSELKVDEEWGYEDKDKSKLGTLW